MTAFREPDLEHPDYYYDWDLEQQESEEENDDTAA